MHNRVTFKMRLEPFSLSETKQHLIVRGFKLNNTQALLVYMCMGGIPFYLRRMKKSLSIAQNVNALCFTKDGELVDEFDILFKSLFDESEAHEELIQIIASKTEGMTRTDIEASAKLSQKGGTLSHRLKELTESGFIMHFIPYGKERGIYYKVTDEFTLFYLKWMHELRTNPITLMAAEKHFDHISKSNQWKIWRGYAFESVCYKHLNLITKALDIPPGSIASTWRYTAKKMSDENGAQIDLLFDRPDDAITLCEIKLRGTIFAIDKKYSQELQNKIKVFQKVTGTSKQLLLSMILSGELKENVYSQALVASTVTLDDLFDDK